MLPPAREIIPSGRVKGQGNGDSLVTPVSYYQRMTNDQVPITRYSSYMLRFRVTSTGNQLNCLVSIEDTATGSQRSFPNVEALATFLLAEFGEGRSAVSSDTALEKEDKRA
jgi:hypothetical protein